MDLLKAIWSKFTSSALATAVGGRIYLDRAPDKAVMPYVVYFIVSASPDKTFTEHYTNTLVQFSLFSASSSTAEITAMYGYLTALFDECSLTIPPTGSATETLVWMREDNLTTMIEDVPVGGTQHVKHWAVDFEILTSRK